MKRVALLILLLASAAVSAAPPTVTVANVSGDPGQPVAIVAVTDAKAVSFYPIDKGVYLDPPNRINDPKSTVATAYQDGVYRVLVYAGNADGPSQPAIVTVTIGTGAQKKLGAAASDCIAPCKCKNCNEHTGESQPKTAVAPASAPVILGSGGACISYWDGRKWVSSCPK